MSGLPAVFLDRDGTIIEESGYLDRLDRLIFYPFSVDAIRGLNDGGFAVVVVTNQAGIARGIVTEEFVGAAHAHIAERMRAGGGADRRVLLLPALPRGHDRRVRGAPVIAANRSRGCCAARRWTSASTSRARSSSAIAGTTRPRGKRSVRAGCWCGPDSAGGTKDREAEPGSRRGRSSTISPPPPRGSCNRHDDNH